MEAGTIVRLAPSDRLVSVSTFEEAFGEHSEFHGRGRARRQKRRLDRIKNRAERKRARQTMRAEQQEARQSRKDTRKKRRVSRKAMGDEAEAEEPEEEETAEDQTAPEAETDEEETDESGEYENATGTPVNPTAIHPKIKDLTKRVVWNREAMRRHQAQKNALQAQYNKAGKDPYARRTLGQYRAPIEKLAMEIQKHEDRISHLENELKAFGDHPHIAQGYSIASTSLQRNKEGIANTQNQASVKKEIAPSKPLVTGLGSERIEIPATETPRTIELSSNAEGDKEKKGLSVPVKIVIGVAAVGLLIVLANKYIKK